MNHLRTSLRQRLLLGTLLWILLSLGLAGWGLNRLFHDHVTRQFHAELRMHLNQLAAHLNVDTDGQPVIRATLSDPRLTRPYAGLYWQVDRLPAPGIPGRPGLLRSRSLWDFVLSVPDDHPAQGEIHDHRLPGPDGQMLRMIELVLRPEAAGSPALRLIVAANESLIEEPLAEFTRPLLIALSVLALTLSGALIVQLRFGLHPLLRLRNELTKLREGRQATVPGDFPSEIQPLVDELNEVLGRNLAFVERARAQAGNLAHAIKTPLSVMANAAAAEPGPLAALINSQVGIARQQVDHHLARARAAAAAQLPGQRCLLAPAVDGLLRLMRRLYETRSLNIAMLACDAHLAFRGEAQDVQEMLGNLLDNACKWARTTVTIDCQLDGHELRITVCDDGPGIPESDIARLLQRGTRADEAIPGSGLGLAIVDDLARLYGGSLSLGKAVSGGLQAALRLPAG
ncbi:MAG: HAMP domain-containing histidine kinase [Azonexus sp.]|nr:HAMP domain-containing histidine kinase [Azonexus sp.]